MVFDQLGVAMSIPKRGFAVSEYERRLDNIQKLMFESKMDAILLTTQVDIEYYTGFKSQFFQSPTRPWYVLIPSCLLYTSPSPRDMRRSRMPSSA